MSRLRWPDSTNSVSDVPGTIHTHRDVGRKLAKPRVRTGLSWGISPGLNGLTPGTPMPCSARRASRRLGRSGILYGFPSDAVPSGVLPQSYSLTMGDPPAQQ